MKSKLKNNKKIAETLRKAADLLESHQEDFCCHAIQVVRGKPRYADPSGEAYEFFEKLFYTQNLKHPGQQSWWDVPYFEREPRIIALLLAADVAERGGL